MVEFRWPPGSSACPAALVFATRLLGDVSGMTPAPRGWRGRPTSSSATDDALDASPRSSWHLDAVASRSRCSRRPCSTWCRAHTLLRRMQDLPGSSCRARQTARYGRRRHIAAAKVGNDRRRGAGGPRPPAARRAWRSSGLDRDQDIAGDEIDAVSFDRRDRGRSDASRRSDFVEHGGDLGVAEQGARAASRVAFSAARESCPRERRVPAARPAAPPGRRRLLLDRRARARVIVLEGRRLRFTFGAQPASSKASARRHGEGARGGAHFIDIASRGLGAPGAGRRAPQRSCASGRKRSAQAAPRGRRPGRRPRRATARRRAPRSARPGRAARRPPRVAGGDLRCIARSSNSSWTRPAATRRSAATSGRTRSKIVRSGPARAVELADPVPLRAGALVGERRVVPAVGDQSRPRRAGSTSRCR